MKADCEYPKEITNLLEHLWDDICPEVCGSVGKCDKEEWCNSVHGIVRSGKWSPPPKTKECPHCEGQGYVKVS